MQQDFNTLKCEMMIPYAQFQLNRPSYLRAKYNIYI